MSADTYEALVQAELRERLYDLRLSRNVNFREGDQTGVTRHVDQALYRQRLAEPDGDHIVEAISSENRIVPILLHQSTCQAETILESKIDSQIIEVVRRPLDTAASWYFRGWGTRFLSDPRAFTLRFNYEGTSVPWFVVGREGQWLASSPADRCAQSVCHLSDMASEGRRLLADRILVMRFEDWELAPAVQFDMLSRFLDLDSRMDPTVAFERSGFPRRTDSPRKTEGRRQFLEKVSRHWRQELERRDQIYLARGES